MADCFLRRRTNQGGNIPIVSWSSGTPAQISKMLQAHDRGLIDIYSLWNIGDERTAHLSAIAANPDGAFITAMDAQDVVMVLMNEGYMGQQGIHYAVGQKDCLNQSQRINQANTNAGGWRDSLVRADINNLYYNAFDSDFKSLFKPFDVITYAPTAGVVITQDYFALFAEKEISGTRYKSYQAEADALSQISYYKKGNKVKKLGNNNNDWWNRSPGTDNIRFCHVNYNGASTDYFPDFRKGIAPFGCI